MIILIQKYLNNVKKKVKIWNCEKCEVENKLKNNKKCWKKWKYEKSKKWELEKMRKI